VKRRFRNGWAVKLPLSHAPFPFGRAKLPLSRAPLRPLGRAKFLLSRKPFRPLGRAKLPLSRKPLHASNATILVSPKQAYHIGYLLAIFPARQEPRPPEEEFAITEH